MRNPWLDIPLADYEGHMSLPQVGQDVLLAGAFATALERYRPASVAVAGCAGGNGFDRIDPSVTRRVVGIDINPQFVRVTAERYGGRYETLQLFAGDFLQVEFEPVDLLFAALFLEYVDPEEFMRKARESLRPGGILVTVIQLPAEVAAVTPSPFTSLTALAPLLRLHGPNEVAAAASHAGYTELASETFRSSGGKSFVMQTFGRAQGE